MIRFFSKRTAWKGKHKIQNSWEDTLYCAEGQPYIGLSVLKTAPVAGEGKVKIVHQNQLLPFGGNIEGALLTREIDKMPVNLRIESWQSLMMVCQGLKLGQQILNLWVRVMQSMCNMYKLKKAKLLGLNHMGVEKIYVGTNNEILSHGDPSMGVPWSMQ